MHLSGVSRREWLALIGVLIVAAVLRFGWVGVNSFAFDEARLSLIALRMARDAEFATLGMPSSVNVPNLPAAAWIFSIPYLFSTDPLVATMFAGLLSMLSVAGIWLLARRWSAWAGIIAATFMAASPFSVLYARSIWAQNLLAPLALVWGGAAYVALTTTHPRRKLFAIALHIFMAGFVWQVHFAGIGLALGTVYLFIRYRWWSELLPVIFGAVLSVLAVLPFVIEVVCCSPQIADEFRALLDSPTQVDAIGFREMSRLALGYDWDFLALGDVSDVGRQMIPAVMAGVLLTMGMAVLLRELLGMTRRVAPTTIRDHRVILGELTLVWLLVTPLFFVRHSTPVFIHYQLAALPALALIVGVSIHLLNKTYWRVGITIAVLTLVTIWSISLGRSLNRAGLIETPNGLGTPLRVSRDAAYGVPDDAPVLFFTHGDDPNLDGEVAVFEALWWQREHRIVQGESLLILPPYPAYLMASLEPFQAWEELRDSGLTEGDVLRFERRDGAQPFVVVRYDGLQSPDRFTSIDPVLFDNGVQLEGWRARRVGARLRISTLWRVVENPPPGIFQQFHHLRTQDTLDGEPFMIADVPLSNHNWRVGDVLIVMGDFFVDAGTYYVDVGQYTLPDVTRFPNIDGGDSLRLGPITEKRRKAPCFSYGDIRRIRSTTD